MNGRFFRFDTWAVSDRGCVRDINEDQYLVEPSLGVWVVADGMGGHDAGRGLLRSLAKNGNRRASQARSASPVRRPICRPLRGSLARANREIQKISRSRNGAVIGSTVAALVAYDRQFALHLVRRQRVYRVRQGEIAQLSRDHTEVQELLDHGIITQQEGADLGAPQRHHKAVASPGDHDRTSSRGRSRRGDIFLLCSDGLTAHVSSGEMLDVLVGNAPRDACERLLQLTLSRGGTDNVTIIVVHCRKSSGTFIPGDSGKMTAERPN